MDFALPEPLAAAFEPKAKAGEFQLIAAVMCRALIDLLPDVAFNNAYLLERGKDRRMSVRTRGRSTIYVGFENITKEAGRWMSSNNDKPFSYLWCCNALGVPPSAMRNFVEREQKKMAKKKGGKKGGGKGC